MTNAKTPLTAWQGSEGQTTKITAKLSTLSRVRAILERRLDHNETARERTSNPPQVRRLSFSISTDRGRLAYVTKLMGQVEREGSAEVCPECQGRGSVVVYEKPDPDCGYPGGTWVDACPSCQGDTERMTAWVAEEFQREVA